MANMTAENKRKSVEQQRRNPSGGSAEDPLQPLDDMRTYLVEYARREPEMAALYCLGIGFVLGWKLKPW